MSAIFDDTGNKYLSGTLTGTVPTPADNIFIASWVKRPSGASQTSAEYQFELKAATEASVLQHIGVAGPKFQTKGAWTTGSTTVAQASNFTADAWEFGAAYMGASVGGFVTIATYDDTTNAITSFSDPDTATESLDRLKIGQGAATNVFSRFPGREAEFSIWTVTSKTVADSLAVELRTKKADAVTVTGATLLFYYPLLSDATATVGAPTLTNNGSVTFDSGDHPSLTGAGGGGSGDVFDYARGIARGIGRGVGMGIRRSLVEVRRPGLWLPPSLVGAR